MIKVTVIYDSTSKTWNAMNGANCLFYGSADQVDSWLAANKSKYEEA